MNENAVLNLKLAITGALSVLTALWGWFGWLVVAWVFLMLADWLVGSAAAVKQGCWSIAKMREGAWHEKGVLTEEDLAEIQTAIRAKNVDAEDMPDVSGETPTDGAEVT